ncbi:MAG: UDP-N-acetylglucosamine--N-acetylmuramyl-(pentapeptide) pyrophosphoryl-undecaprenol N-acetylglucosamine transferase [Longimicrobiales bacterium]
MSRVIFAGGGTGGHLYPALNIAAAMRAARPGLETVFVGARRGVEARVLPEKGVDYRLLPLQPIHRSRVWRNWRLLPSLLGSVWGLARLTGRGRPALVVGTGGYASGPVCGWAVLTGIPVALQEQNAFPGLATRWLSRFARQLHLGFPEAQEHLRPGRRTEVHHHGNPIAPPTDGHRTEARTFFGLDRDSTVALVVGGSQGARAINHALLGALERAAGPDRDGAAGGPGRPGAGARPQGLEILWATGPAHIDGIRARLEAAGVTDWVHATGYIDAMPKALVAADLAVSRAGAMGTAELLAWGVPAILVPLPTSAADHQAHNARALEEAGAARALPEPQLSPDRLWTELTALAADGEGRARMSERALERARPDAARRIAEDLLRIVEAS